MLCPRRHQLHGAGGGTCCQAPVSRRSAKRGGGGRLGLGLERGAGRTPGVNSSMLGTATLVKEQVERRG